MLSVTAADWAGLSVVPRPAFSGARIATVAASATPVTIKKENTVNLQQLILMLRGFIEAERPQILAAHADLVKESGFTADSFLILANGPEKAPAVAHHWRSHAAPVHQR